ncbi:hypothetical protein ABK040_012139 [Willaertia magna]
MEIVAVSKDKYEKLIKEFQKYKTKYSKWKKTFNIEQTKQKQVQSDLEKKENELKHKIEENDILSFNNQRLEKRVAQLMFDLEDLKTLQKSNNQSFFSGFFGNKSNNNSNNNNSSNNSNNNSNTSWMGLFKDDEELNKLKNEIEVLKEELEAKIKENENVHIHLFELKQSNELTVNKFKENISDLQHTLYDKETDIFTLKNHMEELQKQIKIDKDLLNDKIKQLKKDIKLRIELENSLKEHSFQQDNEINYLNHFINRKVIFDENAFESFNFLNLPAKKNIQHLLELLENGLTIVQKLSKAMSTMFNVLLQRVQLLCKGNGNVIKYIYNKITSSSMDIGNNFSKLFNRVIQQLDLYVNNLKKEEDCNLFNLFQNVKDLIQFNCKCLIYFTACLQESECQIIENGNNLIDEDEQWSLFEDKIFMRNNALTKSLKRLLKLFDQFTLFIDVFYLENKRVDEYKSLLVINVPTTKRYIYNSEQDTSLLSIVDNKENNNESDDDTPKKISSEININDIINSHIELKRENEKKSFSIREEVKLIFSTIADSLRDFSDAISNVLAQEQNTNFISPSIKTTNDNLLKSISLVVTSFSSLVGVFKNIQDCEREQSKSYVKGAVVDYDAIVNQKLKGFESNNKNVDDTDFLDYYYVDDSALNVLKKQSVQFMNNSCIKNSESDVTLKEAKENKIKVLALEKELKETKIERDSLERKCKEVQEEISSLKQVLNQIDKKMVDGIVNLQLETQLNFDGILDTLQQPSKGVGYVEKLETYNHYICKLVTSIQSQFSQLQNENISLQNKLNTISNLNITNNNSNSTTTSAVGSDVEIETLNSSEEGIAVDEIVDVKSNYVSNNIIEPKNLTNPLKPRVLINNEFGKVIARPPTSFEEELFSASEIHREQELEKKYSRQIDYLMKQVEICDLKAVQYRIQYQQAIIDLEKSNEHEEKLKLQLLQTEQLLQHTQDELQSSKVNYENQIQLLSDKLADMTIKYGIDSSRESDNLSQSSSTSSLNNLFSSYFSGGNNSSSNNLNEKKRSQKQNR